MYITPELPGQKHSYRPQTENRNRNKKGWGATDSPLSPSPPILHFPSQEGSAGPAPSPTRSRKKTWHHQNKAAPTPTPFISRDKRPTGLRKTGAGLPGTVTSPPPLSPQSPRSVVDPIEAVQVERPFSRPEEEVVESQGERLVIHHAKAVPMLKKKGKFYDIFSSKDKKKDRQDDNGGEHLLRGGDAIVVVERRNRNRNGDPSMEKIRLMRKRIEDGKMEKVVPPVSCQASIDAGLAASSCPPDQNRLAPPPQRNIVYQLTPPTSAATLRVARRSGESTRSHTSTQTHASSTKTAKVRKTCLLAALESGVEGIDETRKELSLKLRPSFEVVHSRFSCSSSNFPSPRTTEKGKGKEREKEPEPQSATTTESFFCQGIDEATSPNSHPLQDRSGRDEQRNTFGGTHDTWAADPTRQCRFCGKNQVSKAKNICGTCEAMFLKAKGRGVKTPRYSSSTTSSEGVKPTPPLKDRNNLLLRAARMNVENGNIPAAPERRSSIGPQILQPAPSSTTLYRGPRAGPEEAFARNEFEKTQRMFRRWSSCYEEENFDGFERSYAGSSRGSNTSKKIIGVQRSTEFYSFWDTLLDRKGRLRKPL